MTPANVKDYPVEEAVRVVKYRSFELIDEVMFVGSFMIIFALTTMSDGMSKNMRKGVNAMRCAFMNGFVNTW